MKFKFRIIFLFVLPLYIASCGKDDLNSSVNPDLRTNLSSDTSRDLDLIYSDSAEVKAQILAPLLVKVVPINGGSYQETSKGIKINFLDPSGKTEGSIVSDYSIMRDLEKTVTFRRHVIVIDKKITYKTEELVWDQNKKSFKSPKGIITKPDGTKLFATNFNATEDFSTVTWENGSGETYLPDTYGQ